MALKKKCNLNINTIFGLKIKPTGRYQMKNTVFFSRSSQIIDYFFLSNENVDRMANSCVAWLPALACKHFMKVSFYPILIPRC
jgi:hypothetical protein